MKKMGKGIAIILGIVFMAGCSTVAGINSRYEKINYSDGVSRNEAVIIAQNHLIATEHKDHYVVSFPEIEEKDDLWIIAFTFNLTSSINRTYARTWYSVYVDKFSGEIVDHALYKGAGVGWGMRDR